VDVDMAVSSVHLDGRRRFAQADTLSQLSGDVKDKARSWGLTGCEVGDKLLPTCETRTRNSAMPNDLDALLKGWDFDAADGSKNVRKIVGGDGRLKVQIRIKCGLIQWDADGRPDGRRPYGKESLLDHCHDLLREHERKYGTQDGFKLSPTLTEEVREEVMDYYHRRLILFQIGDFERARDDANHNLNLMAIVRRFVDDQEIVMAHEKYRAFVLMDRSRAEAMIRLAKHEPEAAVEALDKGIADVKDFYREYDREDIIAESQEIKVLEQMKSQVRDTHNLPLSDSEILANLRDEQKKAVENEDYERAAELREEIAEVMKRLAAKP